MAQSRHGTTGISWEGARMKSPVCDAGSLRDIGFRPTSALRSKPPSVSTRPQSQGYSSIKAWEGGNPTVHISTDGRGLSLHIVFDFVVDCYELIVPQILLMPDSEYASTAHASQESTASECSDKDSNGYKINVHTAAVVAWDGQHAKLDLHLQHDHLTSTAFLKLRTSLVLKALSPARTYLYFLIPPERVQTLMIDDSPEPDSIPSDTAKILGSSFTCLRVSLNATCDLVGPRSVAHKPKNQFEGRVLDQLRSLMRSTAFTIFLPHHVVSKSQLLSMCYGISDRLLRSDPGQIDLACLYEGRGAAKMMVGQPDLASKNAQDASQRPSGDNPPSYLEADPADPIASGSAELPASKKRRRDSETAVELNGGLLAAMRKMVREEIRAQVSEEVRQLEKRLKDNLVILMNKHAEDQSLRWTEELEATRQEFDNRIEDDFFGVRMKLEDYIKEELTETEERIVEHLQRTASVHLEFS